MPSTFAALVWTTASAVSSAGGKSLSAPVAGELRVEHLPQPMQDDRRAGLGQHASVDGLVVGGAGRDAGQRAARHEDHSSTRLLHGGELLEVGSDNVVERARLAGVEVVGADA